MSTSFPQFGHRALAMFPTMNLNPHSGHSIRGDGGSGGRGGGGDGGGPDGGAPRGSAPEAPRTTFTEPHTGQEKRPAPGTSN